MFGQKGFRGSFPEAMEGFARQLWRTEGCPFQAEGAAHAVHGHDGTGRGECFREQRVV